MCWLKFLVCVVLYGVVEDRKVVLKIGSVE